MKNIPLTTERCYLLKLIEEIEIVIKRMRLKVTYCDMEENSIKIETHGLKSQKALLSINDLAVLKMT